MMTRILTGFALGSAILLVVVVGAGGHEQAAPAAGASLDERLESCAIVVQKLSIERVRAEHEAAQEIAKLRLRLVEAERQLKELTEKKK